MKEWHRFIAFLLVFIMLLSTVAMAAPPVPDNSRASDYFNYTTSSIVPTGNGHIAIRFSVMGTDDMYMIGAYHISLYKSNGTLVKSYGHWNYSSMMAYNEIYHYGEVSYNGVSGQSYYAVVTFYACNSNGSDGRQYTTATVTA